MSEWKECTIADLGEVVGGATPSTKNLENYENGTISWITPKDLSAFNGRYIFRGERNITEIGLRSCSTKLLPKNTVLFSSRAPIGYLAIAAKEMCTNQGFKSVIPNADTDYMFLYYLLKYNKDNIENMGSGTTFKEVSGNTMKSIKVRIPIDIEEQRKIAVVLSALDDKIELNTAINENLEQQAQAIFKAWFVDFLPFGGFMPENWIETTLGDVTKNIRKRVSNNYTPVLSAINSGNLVYSDDFFTKQVYSKDISKYIEVQKWGFAYNPARINIGSIGVNDLGIVGCVSPVYVVFSVQEEYQSFFRFYFRQSIFKQQAMTRASGSVRQTLNYSDFSLIDLVYPTSDYAKKFDEIWKSYYDVIVKLRAENERLSEIRDTLLPKLMNGEIDVSAVKI